MKSSIGRISGSNFPVGLVGTVGEDGRWGNLVSRGRVAGSWGLTAG